MQINLKEKRNNLPSKKVHAPQELQSSLLKTLCKGNQLYFEEIKIIKDLSGIDRVVMGKLK